MPSVKIKQAFFLYNGVRYYRTKAEDVELGSYGEKQIPPTKPNYLNVHHRLDPTAMNKAHVRVGQKVAIEWSSQMKGEVGIPKINYLKKAGGHAKFNIQATQAADLVLVKFSIDDGPLCKVINSDAAAKDYLSGRGLKRVVTDVWVVVEAELSEKFGYSATMKVDAESGSMELEVSAAFTGGSKSKVVLSKDTTFAYLLAKPDEWNDQTGDLKDLKPDQQGLS